MLIVRKEQTIIRMKNAFSMLVAKIKKKKNKLL